MDRCQFHPLLRSVSWKERQTQRIGFVATMADRTSILTPHRFIFSALNLAGNTTSLLASGVVGVAMFLATIPAVLYLDKWGRKPTLIAGCKYRRLILSCSGPSSF